MWIYEKRLIYPVNISSPNPRMARIIAGLLGSAAGELTASMTYLNQRFHMPDKSSAAVLTDIGSEELSHLEMLQAMLMQSLDGASNEAIKAAGMEGWVQQYGENSFLADALGNAWTANYVGSSGDPIADLTNDMAAEQKARAGYDGAIRMCDDPDIIGALQFLREREVVHYQRFGEALEGLYDKINKKSCF